MRRLNFRTGVFALIVLAAGVAADEAFTTIFDGKSPAGWIVAAGKRLPDANVQEEGLNPHKSGGYITVHEKPHGDFVLSFDYKLTPGCNTGVFIRVGDLKNPVNTGIEVAIDDTTGTGMHDTGAFYDLVAPRLNAQKPAGQWNHMSISAKGPRIDIELNEAVVTTIDLDKWTAAGERPDGSKHKFSKVVVKDLARKGYLGFQDHGSDCWYKNVKIKDLD